MFILKISDDLEKTLNKRRKEKELIEAVLNKMDEICSQNNETINHYKNLGNIMSDFKRVHIMKSFVLTFKVDLQNNVIYFVRLTHHDEAYK